MIERPPDAWIRVEGTHEAIISQEDFQLAARLKEKDTRKAPGTSAVYPLSGLVCCEAGNYLDHVFPSMGVRFISIGDGYDSADATTADCLVVAWKNLMSQVYSKDISRKSGSILREKIKRGEFIGGYASYGYIKDPEDKHRIIVDPEAAEVVKAIFQKRLEGASNTAITRWLNDSGILSPCCYRYQKGILIDQRYAQPKPWNVQTVKKILSSRVYLGHLVQGRRRSEFYAGRPDWLLPAEEWTIVENTHEAIISQKDFDAVQALCETKNREYHARLGKYDHLGKSENILRGLVYCGDCGRPMVRYKQVVKGKKVTYHYMCPNYAAMLDKSGCAYKFLREDILLDTLTQLIGKEIEQAVDAIQLAKRLSAGTEGQVAARAAEHERLKSCLAEEIERLKEQITALRGEHHRQSETLTVDNPWLQAFSGLRLPDRLTKELAHALIQCVTIYADDKIEVVFKYRDEREQLLTAISEEGVA